MSCFPWRKKARLLEIRAEQHHEHLTEEEKKISAQIRTVAATLYDKVDLDKPTVEFLREHFYKDPTLALAYFYCAMLCQETFNNLDQSHARIIACASCCKRLLSADGH